MFFTRLQNACKMATTMQCVTNSGKTFLQPNFVVAINLGMNWSSFSFFTHFALQSNSKSRLLLYHWRGDNVKHSSDGVTGFSFVRMIGHLDIVCKSQFEIYTLCFYKNNFIRTKALIQEKKKKQEQAKNKVRLAVPQNIRTKCLGQPFLK